MGLLKNDVGRPSNETLKKRRIFYFISFITVLLLICGVIYLLINNNSNGLKTSVTSNYNIISGYNSKNDITIYLKGTYYNDDSYTTGKNYHVDYGIIKLDKYEKNTRFVKRYFYKNGKEIKSSKCYDALIDFEGGNTNSNNDYLLEDGFRYYYRYSVYSDNKCSKELISSKTNMISKPKNEKYNYSILYQTEVYGDNGVSVSFSMGNAKSIKYDYYVDGNKKKTSKCITSNHDEVPIVTGNHSIQFKVAFYGDNKCSKRLKKVDSDLYYTDDKIPVLSISGENYSSKNSDSNKVKLMYSGKRNIYIKSNIKEYSSSDGYYSNRYVIKSKSLCENINNTKTFSLQSSKTKWSELEIEYYADNNCSKRIVFSKDTISKNGAFYKIVNDNEAPVITESSYINGRINAKVVDNFSIDFINIASNKDKCIKEKSVNDLIYKTSGGVVYAGSYSSEYSFRSSRNTELTYSNYDKVLCVWDKAGNLAIANLNK